MTQIRKLEINHFRGIQQFTWFPSPGINCLIGPGDSGKSTILDAIDLCLGARRNLQFCDSDFYMADIEKPIEITLTLGDLPETLKNFDTYGLYLRGFSHDRQELLPEPEASAETVLTLVLNVASDLEPSWTLYSERASAQNQSRNLTWADRIKIAPTRLGAFANHHLSWSRGSVLNRVTDEKADSSDALTKAARQAREAFGEATKDQLATTLAIVNEVARDLGISIGEATAMLDAHSVSFSGSTISLHNELGIPLRDLGLGSARLLIAGLQRKAAIHSSIILVDEVEHGLEPHRIIRLLHSLGSKESPAPLQVFMTTHSPVALRELSAHQLNVLRRNDGQHVALVVGNEDDMQGTIRACAEAFLAKAVILCEGASEIGFIRGLDQHRVTEGKPSITALGVATADGKGDTMYRRAIVFAKLGYRAMVLRDNDVRPPQLEADFQEAGGIVLTWRNNHSLEQEIFSSVSEAAVRALIEVAVGFLGENLINEHIKSESRNELDLARCRAEITAQSRRILALAAKAKNNAWFKSISAMEIVGASIVGPNLPDADEEFRQVLDTLFNWTTHDEN